MVGQNLPQYATPFVGRLTELAEIANRLNNPHCRLLTLIGPGGMGKTRLAVQAALRHARQCADGACFVPLQPLNSPDSMVSAIANTIDFPFYPSGDPKQQLLGHFRDESMLLVLDNLERHRTTLGNPRRSLQCAYPCYVAWAVESSRRMGIRSARTQLPDK
jgi:hypothetical protein